ncbi:MAG: transcriptional regulator [Ectobacillus sp.]
MLSFLLCIILMMQEKTGVKQLYKTESFIKKHMINRNGTLATYRLRGRAMDEDEVAGREALSESSGLWLEYLLKKGDKAAFDQHIQAVYRYLADDSGFILWKASENGKEKASTNALIDDLRIIEQLYRAYDMYGDEAYRQEAGRISKAVLSYNRDALFYVDYYDVRLKKSGNTLTVSYINPAPFRMMKEHGVIVEQQYREIVAFLQELPQKGWAFPKTYRNGIYQYDAEINMIDQSYVAYHRSLAGILSPEYTAFLKKQFEREGKLYGRYNLQTGKPAVSFESPALYGLTILYLLETGEGEFAEQLYKRMKQFCNVNPLSQFHGGYMSGRNTHIFDNLLPLLAEQKRTPG